tara:strand:- start:727 stop:888 length:162 start_codon:yes stop_codon:yes gene_type:complete
MTRNTVTYLIQSKLRSLVAEFAGQGQPDSFTLMTLGELYRVLAVHNALSAQEG